MARFLGIKQLEQTMIAWHGDVMQCYLQNTQGCKDAMNRDGNLQVDQDTCQYYSDVRILQ